MSWPESATWTWTLALVTGTFCGQGRCAVAPPRGHSPVPFSGVQQLHGPLVALLNGFDKTGVASQGQAAPVSEGQASWRRKLSLAPKLYLGGGFSEEHTPLLSYSVHLIKLHCGKSEVLPVTEALGYSNLKKAHIFQVILVY